MWPSQGLYLTLCSWKAILQDSSVVLLECSSEVWFQQCSYLCFNCFVIHQILLAVWDPLAYAQILHNFEHLTTTRSITLLYLYFFNSSIVNLPWIFLTRFFDKGKKVLSVFFRNILYFFFVDQFEFWPSFRWKLMHFYSKKHQLVWMLNRPKLFC